MGDIGRLFVGAGALPSCSHLLVEVVPFNDQEVVRGEDLPSNCPEEPVRGNAGQGDKGEVELHCMDETKDESEAHTKKVWMGMGELCCPKVGCLTQY